MLAMLIAGLASVGSTARADDFDRAGRVGLGGDFAGPAVTYWFSEGFAVDAGVRLSLDDLDNDDTKQYGANAGVRLTLTRKGPLRLDGIAGVNFSGTRTELTDSDGQQSTRYRTETTSLGLGLGVEYSFTELPDLSFGALVTGFSVRYIENERESLFDGQLVDGEFDSGVGLLTTPSISFGVRYYF
jgi:hypothetical protein